MNTVTKIIIPRNEVVLVNEQGDILFESLQENEFLVDVGNFNSLLKPIWSDDIQDFVESATQEEIDSVKQNTTKQITEEEKAIDMMKFLMNNDEFLTIVGITPISQNI